METKLKKIDVDMGYGDELIVRDVGAIKLTLERASSGYALVVKRWDGSVLSSMFYPNESLAFEEET